MGLLAMGCVEGHENDFAEFVESEEFAIEVLRSIKAYNYQIGVGYLWKRRKKLKHLSRNLRL